MLSRISDDLVHYFEAAVAQHPGVVRDGAWDAVLLPGPDSAPIGYFVLEMPGAVLNSRLRVTLLMQNPSLIGVDGAMNVVRHAIEALEKQRSEQLAGNATVTPEATVSHGAVLLG